MKKNITFDEMDTYTNSSDRIKYFSLKDDGDKAVVRFYHDAGEDIEKLPMHIVDDDGRQIKVACLREPGDSSEKCPLCEAGELITAKMYIKLLVYEPDKSGYYTQPGQLYIWEKGKAFRKQLQSLINRYASNSPLWNTVFEIERCGKKGDTQTTYQIYKAELEPDECPLPKSSEDIAEITALGSIVKVKTFDEMQSYCATGKFPRSSTENNVSANEDNSELGTENGVVPRVSRRTASVESTSAPVRRAPRI